VIAAVVHGGGPALQGGQCAVEQRRPGNRPWVVGHPVELPVQGTAPGGQPARGLLGIFSAQNSTSGGSSDTDVNALIVIAWPALVVTTTMPPANWPVA